MWAPLDIFVSDGENPGRVKTRGFADGQGLILVVLECGRDLFELASEDLVLGFVVNDRGVVFSKVVDRLQREKVWVGMNIRTRAGKCERMNDYAPIS